jgi:hypothetical protein
MPGKAGVQLDDQLHDHPDSLGIGDAFVEPAPWDILVDVPPRSGVTNDPPQSGACLFEARGWQPALRDEQVGTGASGRQALHDH